MRSAASAVAGIALAPAQELSFLDGLGPVDTQHGFATAFLRPQPEAPPGWTGGVEHVATAFYRAAMWGGLVVRERHNVPFRVGWLEPPVGFDATVQAPATDLVIANPTLSYVLFETTIDENRESLVVTLLAAPVFTPTVAIGGPLVSEIAPPGEPSTIRESTIPAGARIQVGWAREGARSRVIRSVVLDGIGAMNDEIESAYVPARRVEAVGAAR
jgi:vancomycin resistance protein YoaR